VLLCDWRFATLQILKSLLDAVTLDWLFGHQRAVCKQIAHNAHYVPGCLPCTLGLILLLWPLCNMLNYVLGRLSCILGLILLLCPLCKMFAQLQRYVLSDASLGFTSPLLFI